jgi:predicted MPP superfamily phosphohydrolase
LHDVVARGWPDGLSGLRIAHVSDFHFRRWNRSTIHAQELLKALEYDLLLVTGDFGNFHRHWRHAADMTREFFAPVAGRVPTLAVLGNHDNPRFPTAGNLPLTFLRNQSIRLPIRGAEVVVAGIEQVQPRGGDLNATLAAVEPGVPTILMAHYPSTSSRVRAEQVQLVLSGHTHGGQIRLPWLGCIWPNDHVPRRMACGLHQVNDVHVHVSAGIGASLPIRMRINCPPEIAILTMRCGADSRVGEQKAGIV